MSGRRSAVDESRRAPRRRVFKSAIIQATGIGMSCTVRNISQSGALLIANTDEPLERLTLVIVSEKLVRKCQVVWRAGDKIGVTFV